MNKADFIGECLEAREHIINELRMQLEGPGADGSIPDADHEIITDIPSKRYSCGILYPQQAILDTEDIEGTRNTADATGEVALDTTDKDENSEEEREEIQHIDSNVGDIGENGNQEADDTVDLRNQWFPSSMGITFFVSGNPCFMHIQLTFGTYRISELDDYRYPCDKNLDYDSLPSDVKLRIGVTEDKRFFRVKEAFDEKWVKKVLDTDEAGSCVYDLRIPLMALAQQCNNKYRKSYVRIPHALDFCFEEIKEGLIDLGSSIDDTDCHLTAFCKLMDEDKRIWSITLMVSMNSKIID